MVGFLPSIPEPESSSNFALGAKNPSESDSIANRSINPTSLTRSSSSEHSFTGSKHYSADEHRTGWSDGRSSVSPDSNHPSGRSSFSSQTSNEGWSRPSNEGWSRTSDGRTSRTSNARTSWTSNARTISEETQWSVNEIQQAIDLLCKHQSLAQHDARHQDDLRRALETVNQAAAVLQHSDHYEEIIVAYLRNKQVETVEPETVGQFLFGNIAVDYELTAHAHCTPTGHRALSDRPVADDLPGCDRPVWYYHEGQCRQLTVTPRKYPINERGRADLYIDQDFDGLEEDDLEQLLGAGIEEVRLYCMDIEREKGQRRITECSDWLEIEQCVPGRVEQYIHWSPPSSQRSSRSSEHSSGHSAEKKLRAEKKYSTCGYDADLDEQINTVLGSCLSCSPHPHSTHRLLLDQSFSWG